LINYGEIFTKSLRIIFCKNKLKKIILYYNKMITVYAILYTKPEWTMQSAIEHLSKHCPSTELGCSENDKCYAFTINKNTEGCNTNFLPLSESVACIVKDLCLPRLEEEISVEKEEKKEE